MLSRSWNGRCRPPDERRPSRAGHRGGVALVAPRVVAKREAVASKGADDLTRGGRAQARAVDLTHRVGETSVRFPPHRPEGSRLLRSARRRRSRPPPGCAGAPRRASRAEFAAPSPCSPPTRRPHGTRGSRRSNGSASPRTSRVLGGPPRGPTSVPGGARLLVQLVLCQDHPGAAVTLQHGIDEQPHPLRHRRPGKMPDCKTCPPRLSGSYRVDADDVTCSQSSGYGPHRGVSSRFTGRPPPAL
jgi:hypothetical protein